MLPASPHLIPPGDRMTSPDALSPVHLRRLARGAGGSRLRMLATVFLASTLAGCAVGPDYQTPELNMPAKWGAAQPAIGAKGVASPQNQPPQLGRWWERLNDKTLNRLVEESIAGNLDVATAKARVRQARATYKQSVGALFPTVTGSGSYTRADDGSNVSSNGDVTVKGPYDSYQLGLNASWELDLFGANRRAAEAAKYGLDASEESLRNTLLTLVGDVATNYVEARGYQARIDLARRTATSQRETAALTHSKLEAGSASAVDVANAEGLAAGTEANIPELRSAYQQSVNRLSILIGQPPATLNGRLERSAAIPAPRQPVPKGVPANVLLSRPDVRLAERQLAQYTAQIGQAQAALYPDISLAGNIATSGTKIGDLGKSSTISWSFGPSLSVPIFNAGQLQSAVEYAQAMRDEYFVAYRASVLTALEDVENANVAFHQERLRFKSLTASATSYRQAATLSRSLYQAGSTSFLDVLTAERSLYSAEDSALQSKVAIATDYVSLNKALGGGWDGAVDTHKPEVVDDMGPRFVRADWAQAGAQAGQQAN